VRRNRGYRDRLALGVRAQPTETAAVVRACSAGDNVSCHRRPPKFRWTALPDKLSLASTPGFAAVGIAIAGALIAAPLALMFTNNPWVGPRNMQLCRQVPNLTFVYVAMAVVLARPAPPSANAGPRVDSHRTIAPGD
jgi:hypothetical protein